MANGRVHRVVGAVTGGGFAWVWSAGQPVPNRAVETAGGVLAGAVAGALGGYGSHLALDSFTPRSIPLIG